MTFLFTGFNSLKKSLFRGVFSIMLVCLAYPLSAEQFTASEMVLSNGWHLEFKDGSQLSFQKKSRGLELRWTGDATQHPWLIKSQQVSHMNLEDKVTTEHDHFSQQQLQQERHKWQKNKKKHAEKEVQRLKKEKFDYERKVESINHQYSDKLIKWQQKKSEFDKEAEEEFKEAWGQWQTADKEYHKDLGEFLKAKEEYDQEGAKMLNPSTWFGPPDPPEDQRPLKPERKNFSEPKPLKPKIIDFVPSPERPFLEKEPQLDSPPSYQVTNLILYLALNGCPHERFRLKTGKKIRFVRSRSKIVEGTTPWKASVELLQCEVSSKSGGSIMSIMLDQKRLVSVHLSSPSKKFELQRIFSPALKTFEEESKIREMFLKTLEFSQEPVRASYWDAQERTQLDLKYMVKGQEVLLHATLPLKFYDYSEKNKRNMVSRLDVFREQLLGDHTHLLLKNLFSHPPGDPNNWKLKATINYAIVEDEVANLIKVENKSGDLLEKLEIGSDGLVYDFSGLWYLVSWLNRNGVSELPLIYFNDTRVFVMRLVRAGDSALRFEGRDVPVTSWTMNNLEGETTFQYQVGKLDHIVYEFHALGQNRTLHLKKIDTETISINKAWAESYRKKHRLVSLVR